MQPKFKVKPSNTFPPSQYSFIPFMYSFAFQTLAPNWRWISDELIIILLSLPKENRRIFATIFFFFLPLLLFSPSRKFVSSFKIDLSCVRIVIAMIHQKHFSNLFKFAALFSVYGDFLFDFPLQQGRIRGGFGEDHKIRGKSINIQIFLFIFYFIFTFFL